MIRQPLCAMVLLFALAPTFAVAQVADNQVADNQVDFARDVYPILQRSCFECHGSEKQEAELRLDDRVALFDSAMVEPGSPDDSELLRRVMLPKSDPEVMPAIGDPLRPKQVAILRKWIEQGANWPEDFRPSLHWAYVAPQRAQPPNVNNANWPRNAIDRFVLKRLEAEGLQPSPQASAEKLVRRLHLDLTGLPPTPERVRQFVADPSEAQYERLVDELLASPQFGERWARPWLDLARYADSHGFQRDNLRDVWAYRDWVIRALNEDMPFDQFTLEQIAGDLLPNATESQKIATGFHRCTPTNVEAGSLPEETRIEQVIDRVNTTGAVWLGVTLECCQCHDHKYDPFSAQDYYQLLAFFNSTEREADRANPKTPSSIKFLGPSMPISDAQRDTKRQQLQQSVKELKASLADRRRELNRSLGEWAEQLAGSLKDAPQDHRLEVVEFLSEGATDSYEMLDDGSILLVGGDPPDRDNYVVRLRGGVGEVTALRLETLRHESLPGMGPGRGDPKRRNYILSEFTATVQTREVDSDSDVDKTQRTESAGEEAVKPATASRPLTFTRATADFSQKNWPIANAIDGKEKTGWAISPQFDSGHEATFVLAEPVELTAENELVVKLQQHYGAARTIGRFRISAITGNVDSAATPQEIVAAVRVPAKEWSRKQRVALLDYRVQQDAKSKQLTAQSKKLEKQLASLAPDTTLVMIEMEKPRPTSVFQRGDYRQPGEAVEPDAPAILHDLPPGPRNRITLARWLTARDNPLVARVTVNRWWAELFGHGIVATLEDFGVKGEPPTHPELLDWLAVEFMENGWSMKQLLKTIVMSSTYRQSSQITPELRELDDQNRLLARGPRFRMDAEMIRDNALAVGGLLNLKQFGPPIRPFQPDGIWRKVGGTAYDYVVSPGAEQYRRGVYVVLKRGSPYPSFINFDATARLACTVQRGRTNTPLQALTLLNDKVYVDAANALAKRVQHETTYLPLDGQIAHAFQLCTARRPTRRELETLQRLFEQQLAAHQPTDDEAGAIQSAWRSVATVLLNLHETITKD